jgi:mycothiol maleylpyruvate isomerase-like protein
VPLCFTESLDHSAVVRAADVVADLVGRPEVSAAWTRESSCAGMTVGGLTRHLIDQPASITTLLTASAKVQDAQPIEILEHYARAAWVREDLDGETNRSIRSAADAEAAEGPDAASQLLSDARGKLPTVLADAPPTVFVPWQGWSLATDDFLVIRLMEMVVHADDLAASVDVGSPDFGSTVHDPVFRLLAALAVRRHGQDALVRTFARPQRAPETVSAF